MNICMILKRNFVGLKNDSRVLREAKALIKEGNNLSILLSDEEKDEKHEYKGLKIRNVATGKESILRFRARSKIISFILIIVRKLIWRCIPFIRYFYYVSRTVKAGMEEDADVYHCHDLETLIIGIVIKKKKHEKVLVYDAHEIWTESINYIKLKERIGRKIWELVEKICIAKIDAMITVSDSLSLYFNNKYGIEPHVIRNVPEIINTKNENNDLLRKDLNISESKKIVIYQGGLSPNRCLEYLIEAWKYVHLDYILVIMGYGPLYDEIKKTISINIYKNRVFLKDAVNSEQLLDVTRSADLGICPIKVDCLNNYYSCPNKMWEYILAGVPFLATDIPEMRKMAIEENMGIVVNPESSKDIAEKINFIFDNKNLKIYEEMKNNCIKKGKEKYNWDIEKKVLLNLYEHI